MRSVITLVLLAVLTLASVGAHAADDADDDGLSDAREYWLGLDPQEPDTDGDGSPDGVEVRCGSSPYDPLESVPLTCGPGSAARSAFADDDAGYGVDAPHAPGAVSPRILTDVRYEGALRPDANWAFSPYYTIEDDHYQVHLENGTRVRVSGGGEGVGMAPCFQLAPPGGQFLFECDPYEHDIGVTGWWSFGTFGSQGGSLVDWTDLGEGAQRAYWFTIEVV